VGDGILSSFRFQATREVFMSQALFIPNDAPYGTERSYNAVRLAGTLAKRDGEAVRIFLIGDAAACAKAHQKVPAGYYNIGTMLHACARHGAEIGVCGSWMDARAITEPELTEGTHWSTMEQSADWTQRAGRVLAF
jgi:uncharacterized protein involved in oxidation of intracellular sulfur